jgi:hypothetical protein
LAGKTCEPSSAISDPRPEQHLSKTYGDEAIEVVRRAPYRLAGEVWGIGFKTADRLARSLGIPHDSPQRVKAGLQLALSQASDDGHCHLPETELVTKATELLGVDNELARRCLEKLVAEEGVVAEPLPTHRSPEGPVTCSPSCCQVRGTPAEVTVTMVLVSGSHRVAAIRPLAVGRAGHLGRALVVHDQGAGVARFGCACKSRRR